MQVPTISLQEEAADLMGIVLELWHPWSGVVGEEFQALTQEFNSTNEWGIAVKTSYQGNLDDLAAKVEAAIDDQSLPDMAVSSLHQALTWDARIDLADLKSYVNDAQWGLTQSEITDFYPALWESDLYQERRLGIPALRYGFGLLYNQSWAKDLGFAAPPATEEDFRRQACAAAVANLNDEATENDGTGGWIVSTDYLATLGWLGAFGAQVAASPASPQSGAYQYDTSEVEDAFTFLRNLFDARCAWIDEEQPGLARFAARQALFVADNLANLEALDGNQDTWRILPFPGPESKGVLPVYGPSFRVLADQPERQLAAWLFLKWLLSPENQARLSQAGASLPLGAAAAQLLDSRSADSSHLLSLAQSEPALPSWSLARWALSDAATQLFRYYFSVDQVPELVKFLDQTSDDLAISPLTDRFLLGGTATPTPRVTPTP